MNPFAQLEWMIQSYNRVVVDFFYCSILQQHGARPGDRSTAQLACHSPERGTSPLHFLTHFQSSHLPRLPAVASRSILEVRMRLQESVLLSERARACVQIPGPAHALP